MPDSLATASPTCSESLYNSPSKRPAVVNCVITLRRAPPKAENCGEDPCASPAPNLPCSPIRNAAGWRLMETTRKDTQSANCCDVEFVSVAFQFFPSPGF